ncbi:unnamed protein product, partial [Closterium sp. NIES-65]
RPGIRVLLLWQSSFGLCTFAPLRRSLFRFSFLLLLPDRRSHCQAEEHTRGRGAHPGQRSTPGAEEPHVGQAEGRTARTKTIGQWVSFDARRKEEGGVGRLVPAMERPPRDEATAGGSPTSDSSTSSLLDRATSAVVAMRQHCEDYPYVWASYGVTF